MDDCMTGWTDGRVDRRNKKLEDGKGLQPRTSLRPQSDVDMGMTIT